MQIAIRIICFDKKGDNPIIALIDDGENYEECLYYPIDGKNIDHNYDLMMLSEKKEGCVSYI